jgi:hypothetical protein
MCSEEKQRRRDVTDTMQVQLDNLRSTDSGGAQLQMYRGAVVDYVQWRSSWQERDRDSEESEEVQLNQLKKKIPEKNINQMGLADIKTIKGFWNIFEEKILQHFSQNLFRVRNRRRKKP